jgi:PST family polysaccharide transporter
MSQSRLLHNIAALGSLQIANYMLGLVTIPIVTRALGVESWGHVAFAQVVLNYFIWVTNWGFHLSATRRVAASRGDIAAVSEIFMGTWAAQWALGALVIATLLAMILIVPMPSVYRSLFFAGTGLVIGNILFPGWFLIGAEKMRESALIQIVAKLATLPLIFFLVTDSDDGPLFLAINSATGMLAGFLALGWMHKKLSLIWSIPRRQVVVDQLRHGASLFGTTIWISLYSNLAPTFLAILAGPIAVGTFALADRARAATQAVMAPATQALFPRMSQLYVGDHNTMARLLYRSGALITAVAFLCSAVLWVFAEPITYLLGGSEFSNAAEVLKWLSPVPMLMGVSVFLGVQVLLPAGKTKTYNIIYVAAGILNLILIGPLILAKGIIGATVATLLTESFVAMAMAVYAVRNGFFIRGQGR